MNGKQKILTVNNCIDFHVVMLKEAGIYVLIGLGATCKDCAIGSDPAPACYSAELKRRGQLIISHSAKYPNVLGFSAGNEVELVSPDDPTANAPCQKKFNRDMREWVAGCPSIRHIPIGLAVADANRQDKRDYYTCQGDGNEFKSTEWFGLNSYIFCDPEQTDVTDSAAADELIQSMGKLNVVALRRKSKL